VTSTHWPPVSTLIETVVVPPATIDDLAVTVRLAEVAGGRIVTEVVDVRDPDGLRGAVDAGARGFGGIDIVCATAGITSRGMATELDEQTWQTMLDVNLTGVWRTCKVAVSHLIARGSGAVVLVSSIAGLRGLVGVAHYTAAKHGVVGLMRSLAQELAPQRIRVNTNVDTPMIQNAAVSSAFRPELDRAPTRAEFAESARSMNMLDIPWIDPVDVANASLFLASDEARYITAVALPVDAGSTQR
jgi:NAD(P)-dependent dehydrogenase (short-subunit alcohol dehydrogenase family)